MDERTYKKRMQKMLDERRPLTRVDENLAALSVITPADGTIIVGDGSTFVGESGATAAAVAIIDESTGPNYYYNNKMITGVQESATYDTHYRGPINNRKIITPKTAAYIVSPYDSGRVLTNTGATGTVAFTLPSATLGLKYTFTRIATQVIQVAPKGTEIIRGGTAGQYAQLDTDGAMIAIECHTTGVWEVVSSVETVTFH